MPHFIYEYSANLDDRLDIDVLCMETLRAAGETGVFEPGAIRVRAIRCTGYAIADAHPENAFLDLVVRMRAGRPPEVRRAVGEVVFAAIERVCAPLFERPHFALSFEIREIDPEMSWRRNSIHPRLRRTGEER